MRTPARMLAAATLAALTVLPAGVAQASQADERGQRVLEPTLAREHHAVPAPTNPAAPAAELALARTLARGRQPYTAQPAIAAAATPPTGIEDQNDRLLRSRQAAQADRTQAAVALARSMERNLTPVATGVRAAQPTAQPDTTAPGGGVDVLATLLVGLVGGLVGGAAVAVGWTATARRRPRAVARASSPNGRPVTSHARRPREVHDVGHR